MIVPEIDHHLFELTRAVERAQYPRLGRLAQDDPGSFAARLDLFRRWLHPAAREPRPVLDEQLDRVEPQRLEPRQPRRQLRRIGKRLGIQLLGDIALDADRLDAAEILLRRAEGEAVQDVQDLPVGGRRGGVRQPRQSRQPETGRGSGQKRATQHGGSPISAWCFFYRIVRPPHPRPEPA